MKDIVADGSAAWAAMDQVQRQFANKLYTRVYGVQPPSEYPPLFAILAQLFYEGEMHDLWIKVVRNPNG